MPDRTPDPFEEELNSIRLALYEDVKDLTPEEFIAYLHRETAPIIQQYGMKTSTFRPGEPQKGVAVPA